MTLTTLAVKDCFADREVGNRVVPSFHFLCIDDDSPIRLMRLQSKAELRASAETGIYSVSEHHLEKCRSALRLARAEYADVFLTPEYCVPIQLIDEMISDTELQPRPNTLWCLSCAGVSVEQFEDCLQRWGDRAIVGKRTLEGMRLNRFINFILYVFVSKEGDKLCFVPQLKLQRMREAIFVCEGQGLSLGKRVIVFGEETENQLFSILCADAFHPEVQSGSLFFRDRRPKRYIVLHPQLNPAPRHLEMSGVRNLIFGTQAGNQTIYITANWAYGTTVTAKSKRLFTIHAPWSTIYRRFMSYDGMRSWHESLREVRTENLNYGLGLGYQQSKKIKVWFANKGEHLQQVMLAKPYDGGPEIARPIGHVRAVKAYIPNDEHNGWRAKRLRFEEQLPASIVAEAAGHFSFPHEADKVEDKEKLFGYSLGHMEIGQLLLDEREYTARISYHVDDHCEPARLEAAEMIAKLMRRLKSNTSLPGQFKRFQGRFQFRAAKRAPFNILPMSGNEMEGVLAIYTRRESSKKQIVDHILKSMSEVSALLEDRICVFSQDENGNDVHYPEYSEEYTSPVRSTHTVEYTHGGGTAQLELD